MPGELHEMSVAIGELKANVENLNQTVRDNQEVSRREHRLVHDIVVATSEAVRNLTATVKEMKPLTDDYREKRAENRGRKNLVTTLYVMLGGMIGALATRLLDVFSVKPN